MYFYWNCVFFIEIEKGSMGRVCLSVCWKCRVRTYVSARMLWANTQVCPYKKRINLCYVLF